MSNSPMQNSTDQVKQELKSAYESSVTHSKSAGLFWSLLILFSGLIVLILAEQAGYFSNITKGLLLLILSGLGIFSYMNFRKGFSSEQFKEFYRNFSRQSQLPELKDALDLENSRSGNRELVDAAILQNLARIEPNRLSAKIEAYIKSRRSYTLYKRSSLLLLVSFIMLCITSLNFQDAAQRTITFWENYEKPNPFLFAVNPGNVTLEQGNPFQVRVTFQGGDIPEDVSLHIKTDVEEEFRSRSMEHSATTFTSIEQDLNNRLEYYIQMDGFKSKRYIADVQLRPRFTDLQVTVTPPAYTGMDSSITSYPFSQIRAIQGSEINFSGQLNKAVSTLEIDRNGETIQIDPTAANQVSYQIEAQRNDTLSFNMVDESGLTNQNPFRVFIVPQQDEYPIVELIEPEQNIEQVNPVDLNLLYRATDDFGLSSAVLNYELSRAYVEEPITGSVALDTPRPEALEAFSWDLSSLELRPRDVLTFWISVSDNDGYNGFKTSSSLLMTLEVPSMVDYFEGVDEREDEVGSDLNDISESFEQTRDQYERFKEMMKDNPENPGYEENRELEQVKKQQEEVQSRIDELNKKFEELKTEMSRDNMLSEETQQAYEELQKLMEEVDDPAYREALEKLQEQMGQMNPEQLRQAMEELEFNEEVYRERIERTIELFKQLKLTSDLSKLKRSFENLAQDEQYDLNELQNLLQENQQLSEQVDSLSQNTSNNNEQAVSEYQEQTRQRLEKLSQEIKEELSEQGEETTDSEGQENSDQQNSDSGSENQASPQQQNRQQEYQQLANNTQSLIQSMGQQQMSINVAGLQYVLYSLLNLSLEQEDLTILASDTENQSQAYVTYARNQRNVESIFRSISDSLFQLSTEIPQFSNQINQRKEEVERQLTRSLEMMSERDQSRSSIASRQALGGINDISFLLANLLEQLQNSGSGSGQGGGGGNPEQMMEQLRQSGQSQQQLNQMMQDMINDIQGERLTRDQMQRMEQLARQQNRIRKQLQELQQSGELDGDRLGSELQRMIEDMEDTINDLRGGSTDPIMIERQQNIMSRMLEAEQAIQQREEEEDQREGTAAEELERATPPELTLEELEKQIRNRLNDPNFTKYSQDYQRLIEKYFELLKELQEAEIQ